ncbi:BCL2/adenovirus E1B 19 kDa protein-interacting protein 3-like [Pholidichthys leucotaenia]
MSNVGDVSSDDSLQGSWVELHFNGNDSRSSSNLGSHEQNPSSSQVSDIEKMLLEAQHESGRSSSRGSSQCNSPPRGQTPPFVWRTPEGSGSQSDEEISERLREVESFMRKKSDWILDWSSRPENSPPKELLLKYTKRSTPLSIRKTVAMKKGGFLSSDFLKIFLPSVIISHILAIGLGIYIGKRISHSR